MPKTTKSFMNTSFFGLYNNSDSDYFNYTMANLQDAFFKTSMNQSTEGKFQAVVLSGLFSPGENTGFSDEWTDARIIAKGDAKYFQCIVRPIGLTEGLILPDPCKPFLDMKTRRQLIEMHPWATSEWSVTNLEEPPTLYPGQVITCYYEAGTIGNSTYSDLKFENPKVGGKSSPLNSQCLTAFSIDPTGFETDYAGIFSEGAVPTLDVTDTAPGGEIAESSYTSDRDEWKTGVGAAAYDSWRSTSKNAQAPYLAILHPEVRKHVKAIIYDVYKILGYTIWINSSYRTRARQANMRAEYIAWENGGKVGKAPYAAKPATAGSSMHNFAAAIDFNPIKDGKSIKSTAPKQDWIDSRIPQIIHHYGLRWGGNFSTNYDPIHMDVNLKDVSKEQIDAAVGTEITSATEAIELIKDLVLGWDWP